jgi:hypothetical protein
MNDDFYTPAPNTPAASARGDSPSVAGDVHHTDAHHTDAHHTAQQRRSTDEVFSENFYDAQETEQQTYYQDVETASNAAMNRADVEALVQERRAKNSEKRKDQYTWWQMLLVWLLPTEGERADMDNQRLWMLNETIAAHPDNASAYLLRAELFAEYNYHALAVPDFERAIIYATQQIEQAHKGQGEAWGLIAQSVQDRAMEGLAKSRLYRL